MSENIGKQVLNGSLSIQCVPALDVKMLLRRAPCPQTLTYVLLTYVLEMPDCGISLSSKLRSQEGTAFTNGGRTVVHIGGLQSTAVHF